MWGNHVSQFHAVHIGHLDIQKQQVNGVTLDHGDGFHGIGKTGHEFEVFGSGNEGFKEFHGQGLVIDNDAGHRGCRF